MRELRSPPTCPPRRRAGGAAISTTEGKEKGKETGNFKEFAKPEQQPAKVRMANGKGVVAQVEQ
jgi:hypothetical protein